MESRQAEEEVFETPDVEGGGGAGEAVVGRSFHSEQQSDPESLVPAGLDPDAAFEVFHGKRYETDHIGKKGKVIIYPRPSCAQ